MPKRKGKGQDDDSDDPDHMEDGYESDAKGR